MTQVITPSGGRPCDVERGVSSNERSCVQTAQWHCVLQKLQLPKLQVNKSNKISIHLPPRVLVGNIANFVYLETAASEKITLSAIKLLTKIGCCGPELFWLMKPSSARLGQVYVDGLWVVHSLHYRAIHHLGTSRLGPRADRAMFGCCDWAHQQRE